MAWVYILKDKRGKFYTGSTGDLQERLREHKRGHTFTTRRMLDPRLVLSQEYASLSQARKVERKIKSMKRKDYIEKMVKEGNIKLKV